MKKSLLALAVLGTFAASAQAQSSVSIYGSFDAGIRYVTDVNAAGDNRTTMSSNGTYNSNRLGFRGTEDLGGGLNARFALETGFNSGNGLLDNATNRLFNRTASVGVGGAWGSIDLGRQYNVAFKTIVAYDPLNYKYTGIASAIPATAGTRFDNDIQYNGTFGPVTVRAEYVLGEQPGGFSDASSQGLGVSYAAGPLALCAAYTKRNDVGAAGLDNKHWTLGGAYKLGDARVAAGFAKQKQDVAGTGTTNDTKWAWIGASYTFTPAFEFSGAYYRTKQAGVAAFDGKKDLFMVSATYALSNRTNLYAEFDTAKLEGAMRVAAPQDRQRGISLGISHLF